MHRKIKIIVRTFVLACLALSMPPLTHAQMTGSVGGSVDQTGPALPRVWIASTLNSTNFPDIFPTPLVTKYVCSTSGGAHPPRCDYGRLQDAIKQISSDALSCGELISVDTVGNGFNADPGLVLGATNGPEHFTVACPANKHVLIQSWGASSLQPQGARPSDSDESNMFEVDASCNLSACKFTPVWQMDDGADGLVVDGMLTKVSGTNVGYVIQIGGTSGSGVIPAVYASHDWWGRFIIQYPTSYSTLTNHTVFISGNFNSFTDYRLENGLETISDRGNTYAEAHGFTQIQSTGPTKIVNGVIDACYTESLLFGGATTLNPLQIPSDLEIRQNYIYVDPGCANIAALKNLLEFKKGIRILKDGNVLQNMWNSAANGGEQNAPCSDYNVAASTAADFHSAISDFTDSNNHYENCQIAVEYHGYSADSNYTQFPEEAKGLFENDLWSGLSVAQGAPIAICPIATCATQNELAQTVSSATFSGGAITYNVSSTAGWGTTSMAVCTGFSPNAYNAYLLPVTNVVTNASITVSIANAQINSTAASSPANGTCGAVQNRTVQGISFGGSQDYWTPPGFPGVGTAQITATSCAANGVTATCTLPSLCSGTASPSNCFQVGQALQLSGFVPANFNVTYSQGVAISAVNSALNTITFPLNYTGSSTTQGSVAAEFTLQAPHNITFDHVGLYGAVCPATSNCSTVISSNLAQNVGTNGESVTHFASPKSSTATTQIPEWTLTNSIFVVDQDTFQGDGGATVKTWITDGALIDPYFANNLAITPAGTMFNTASPANLPSSGPGAPNGSVGAVGNTLTANLAALNTTLGMVSYSGCVTPDPSPGDSASLPNCIITGSHAAQGPNIAQIQAHQSLGNDTTLWGPRSPW